MVETPDSRGRSATAPRNPWILGRVDDLRPANAQKPNHKGIRNGHRVNSGKLIGLKPSRSALTITRSTRTECTTTSKSNADRRSDPASWKAHANKLSAADSNCRSAVDRKRMPTLCSPLNAASKAPVGPTFSIGGHVAPLLPDQKSWKALKH